MLDSFTLQLSSLPQDLSTERLAYELKVSFKPSGPPTKILIAPEKEDAFLTFDAQESADKARLAVKDGLLVNGRAVKLVEAMPRKSDPPKKRKRDSAIPSDRPSDQPKSQLSKVIWKPFERASYVRPRRKEQEDESRQEAPRPAPLRLPERKTRLETPFPRLQPIEPKVDAMPLCESPAHVKVLPTPGITSATSPAFSFTPKLPTFRSSNYWCDKDPAGLA